MSKSERSERAVELVMNQFKTHDPLEAAARALTKHKSLSWKRMKESWREEQYKQAQVILDAIVAAQSADGWSDPDDGDVPSALG